MSDLTQYAPENIPFLALPWRLLADRKHLPDCPAIKTLSKEARMDQAIVPFMLRLLASNLGATLTTLVVLMLHFWAFAYFLHRGQRTMQASLERIEGSNERIAQMVRDLHR